MIVEGIELRDKVDQAMAVAQFATDTPGVVYGQPDIMEFRYTGSGGGELFVRSIGGRLKIQPSRGSWSEIPEEAVAIEESEMGIFVMLGDPRQVVKRLEDIEVEERGEKRVLRGIVGGIITADSLDSNSLNHLMGLSKGLEDLSIQEIAKKVAPHATLEIDAQNRVTSMEVKNFVGEERDGREIDGSMGTLHFFYQ